jgi:hypothetical protein
MIDDHKSMSDLTPERQAKKALAHILDRVRSDSRVGWYLGHGTESFALATEALATLTGNAVFAVRKAYAPENPKDPCQQGKKDFIDARPEYKPKLDEKELKTLADAIALLDELAEAEARAAATTTRHDGLAHLQKSERMEEIARSLRSIKYSYER